MCNRYNSFSRNKHYCWRIAFSYILCITSFNFTSKYHNLSFFLHNNIVTFFIITNSKINRFEILWCFGKHSKTLRNFFFIEFGSFFWAYFHFILLAMHQLTFNLKKKQFYKMQYSSYEDKQEILTQASKTTTKYITLYDFIFTLQQA